jgi:bacillithiol biosynthesis deacetylase BshB1
LTDFDIAGICAHPDDAELVMGGTLAAEAARGRRIVLVDLTRGESGSRGTPESRAVEAEHAGRLLGVARRETLGLPDGGLAPTPEQQDTLVGALRRLRPRVVLLQHWRQRHPDHAAASRIVYKAAFLAGLKNYRPELGAAFRPSKLGYALPTTEAAGVEPSFVVDVTPFWPVKLRAIEAFASQFTPAPSDVPLPFDGWRSAVELAARRQGQRIGVEFGEGFVVKEPFRVDDVAGLPVPSF